MRVQNLDDSIGKRAQITGKPHELELLAKQLLEVARRRMPNDAAVVVTIDTDTGERFLTRLVRENP